MVKILAKGDSHRLSGASLMKRGKIGAGWDVQAGQLPNNPKTGKPFDIDLDLAVVTRDKAGVALAACYYDASALKVDNYLEHSGDNRSGAGEGDDETITVSFDNVPTDVEFIDIIVQIDQNHELIAAGTQPVFGLVEGGFVRFVNADNDIETVRLELDKVTASAAGFKAVAVWFARLRRDGPTWIVESKLDYNANLFKPSDPASDIPLQGFCDQTLP